MIYSVMLSAYGLYRKNLEDQVSVTNSIFGTDLSVNTDEEYIIHCDDLSKIIDPDNKYSWFGSLRNITTLSTNMSNSEILKKDRIYSLFKFSIYKFYLCAKWNNTLYSVEL